MLHSFDFRPALRRQYLFTYPGPGFTALPVLAPPTRKMSDKAAIAFAQFGEASAFNPARVDRGWYRADIAQVGVALAAGGVRPVNLDARALDRAGTEAA